MIQPIETRVTPAHPAVNFLFVDLDEAADFAIDLGISAPGAALLYNTGCLVAHLPVASEELLTAKLAWLASEPVDSRPVRNNSQSLTS